MTLLQLQFPASEVFHLTIFGTCWGEHQPQPTNQASHTGRTTITGRQSTLNENPPIKTDIPHKKEKPTAIRLVLPTNTFEKEV